MKNFSFLIRLLILICSLIVCCYLVIGIFTKSNTLALKARLSNQRVVLSIENETKEAILEKVEKADKDNGSLKEENHTNLSQNINNKKVITVVITNLGLSKAITDKAFTLPSEVVFGFSPYTVHLDEYLKKAVTSGHETLIYIPMQTNSYPQEDPGPLGLLKNLSNLENFQRFQTTLESYYDYVGIYTTKDEVFTDSNSRMQPFIQYLKSHKLVYAYGGMSENQAFHQFADQMKFPLLNFDLILDEDITQDSIKTQLSLLEKIAEKQGYALGFANSYPITIDTLNEWLPTLEKKDIYLVPITLLYKKITDNKQ